MTRRGGGLPTNNPRTGWLLLSPTLLIVMLVGIYPLLHTFWVSLTDARMASGRAPQFIGLQNYQELLVRKPFWQAVTNTITITVASVSLEVLLGLGIALIVNSGFRGRGIVRAAMLVPWAIPTVVSARMWNYMLVDTYGVVNDILYVKLGLLPERIAWLAEPGLAMASVIAVDVWKTTPFAALLLLAGLQLISPQLYEAASVDGATRWQKFRSITLPMLMPALLVVLIFRSLDALRIFDAVWVLTRGQLGTETVATYTFRQMIDFRKLGFGSAASVVLFALIAMFVLVYFALLRWWQGPQEGDEA